MPFPGFQGVLEYVVWGQPTLGWIRKKIMETKVAATDQARAPHRIIFHYIRLYMAAVDKNQAQAFGFPIPANQFGMSHDWDHPIREAGEANILHEPTQRIHNPLALIIKLRIEISLAGLLFHRPAVVIHAN